MDKTGIHPGGEHAHIHVDSHGEHHEDLGFWRKYVFSVDHKVIGIQYTITGLLFLLFGFTLMMIMRWQLAYPGRPIPLIGMWLGQDRAPMGVMLPEFYNQLGAMHGTIMVFMGVVPLAVGGFGNFVMPLQIGARRTGGREDRHGARDGANASRKGHRTDLTLARHLAPLVPITYNRLAYG